jgi:hypothetical protein
VCGEGYDGQNDWTQVTCFRLAFFGTEDGGSWFFRHWSFSVSSVEMTELLIII